MLRSISRQPEKNSRLPAALFYIPRIFPLLRFYRYTDPLIDPHPALSAFFPVPSAIQPTSPLDPTMGSWSKPLAFYLSQAPAYLEAVDKLISVEKAN